MVSGTGRAYDASARRRPITDSSSAARKSGCPMKATRIVRALARSRCTCSCPTDERTGSHRHPADLQRRGPGAKKLTEERFSHRRRRLHRSDVDERQRTGIPAHTAACDAPPTAHAVRAANPFDAAHRKGCPTRALSETSDPIEARSASRAHRRIPSCAAFPSRNRQRRLRGRLHRRATERGPFAEDLAPAPP
jgi:hypothetical protein